MSVGTPYRAGSPEAAEWAAIDADPAWHAHPSGRRAHAHALLTGRFEDTTSPDWVSDDAFARRGLARAGVIVGPDVSQYQGRPAWGTVRASGCVLKFWKATEGRTFLDPSAAWNAAPVPGMVDLAYHFLYYSDEYAAKPSLWGAQADWFVRNTPAGIGHALDVEAAAAAGHWLGVREWVAEYRRLRPGHPLGLYTNKSLWRGRSRMPYDPHGLFDYIWHAGIADGVYIGATGSLPAQWGAVRTLTDSVSALGYPAVRLWQITDHAAVPGITGTCDGNAWQGSAAELAATLTGDDVVTSAEMDQIAARAAAAVWASALPRPWDGKTASAGSLICTTHYYAVQAGYEGTVPATSTTSPGAATHAARIAGLLPAVDAVRAAVAADPTLQQITDTLHAVLGSGSGGTLTRVDVADALAEALTRVHLTAQPPPPAPPAGGGS